jgi:hypothetical protein
MTIIPMLEKQKPPACTNCSALAGIDFVRYGVRRIARKGAFTAFNGEFAKETLRCFADAMGTFIYK